jgi:hypothetical protein
MASGSRCTTLLAGSHGLGRTEFLSRAQTLQSLPAVQPPAWPAA